MSLGINSFLATVGFSNSEVAQMIDEKLKAIGIEEPAHRFFDYEA